LLNLKACIVPENPGNLSAFGLLMVDYRSDHVFTKVTSEDDVDATEVAAIYDKLSIEAAGTLERDGIAKADVKFLRQADVRYEGQSMEVRVNVPEGEHTGSLVAEIAESFHTAHERIFGYCYRGGQKIELVNFAVSGIGEVNKPALKPVENVGSVETPAPDSTRPVSFDGSYIETPIFDRANLAPGLSFTGPMVIEEFGSTTVVFPGQSMSVDPHGILIIRSEAK
jgi:N-methylhydantoinase A